MFWLWASEVPSQMKVSAKGLSMTPPKIPAGVLVQFLWYKDKFFPTVTTVWMCGAKGPC